MPAPGIPIRSRLAPTPSGYLHAGNLYSFVLTWLWMQNLGGSLLLRIDDMDAERSRPEYVQDIFDSLAWAGLPYDEGPVNPETFAQQWSQHHRIPLYNELLEKLVETGMVYACTCSRREIFHFHPKGIYPGHCRHRNLPLDTPGAAWRVHVPGNTAVPVEDVVRGRHTIKAAETLGDFVVRRKDGLPAYQVSSLADDLHFRISHGVRGADLLHSTAAQLYLASLTSQAPFLQIRWWHHALISAPNGLKLSKSAGDTSLQSMRARGQSAAEVLARLFSGMPGFADEAAPFNLTQLRQVFNRDPYAFMVRHSMP